MHSTHLDSKFFLHFFVANNYCESTSYMLYKGAETIGTMTKTPVSNFKQKLNDLCTGHKTC